MNYLKVISHNSTLAALQVKEVFNQYPGLAYELITHETYGDKQKEIAFPGNPPANQLISELYQPLLKGIADIAIHSVNDLPYPLPTGLEVIALIDSFDQTDSLVSHTDILLNELPSGITVVSVKTVEVLPYKTTPLQGKLAVVAIAENPELAVLFEKNDIRNQFGRVTMVGFGPGDPDLLTIAGERSIAEADIIFHDDLVDFNFLDRYKAEKIYVGKRRHCHSHEQDEINRMMADAAMNGKKVVRLKGGDPMIFAHGGEEVEYLKRNFIPVKVIPGVSTGTAVASLTQIPLTLRGIAKSVAFITGHAADIQLPVADTLVCFMAGSTIHLIAAKAIAEGRDPNTPVALVYNVSLPDQKEYLSNLELLSRSEEKYPTPVIIIIGEVVSFRKNPPINGLL